MDKASVRKVKIVEVQKQGLLQFPYIFLQQREREREKNQGLQLETEISSICSL